MRNLEEMLMKFFFIVLPVIVAVFLVAGVFGLYDLGAVFEWIGLNFAQFALYLVIGGAILFVVVAFFPVVIIILACAVLSVIGVALFGLLA